MNYGLPQGFVLLGSTHARILQLLHEHGPLRLRDLVEELGLPSSAVSMALLRLHRAGFIFDGGKVGQYEAGDRTQRRWSLTPLRSSYRPATSAERCRRSDAARSGRVTSVFDWRPRGHPRRPHGRPRPF